MLAGRPVMMIKYVAQPIYPPVFLLLFLSIAVFPSLLSIVVARVQLNYRLITCNTAAKYLRYDLAVDPCEMASVFRPSAESNCNWLASERSWCNFVNFFMLYGPNSHGLIDNETSAIRLISITTTAFQSPSHELPQYLYKPHLSTAMAFCHPRKQCWPPCTHGSGSVPLPPAKYIASVGESRKCLCEPRVASQPNAYDFETSG